MDNDDGLFVVQDVGPLGTDQLDQHGARLQRGGHLQRRLQETVPLLHQSRQGIIWPSNTNANSFFSNIYIPNIHGQAQQVPVVCSSFNLNTIKETIYVYQSPAVVERLDGYEIHVKTWPFVWLHHWYIKPELMIVTNSVLSIWCIRVLPK